MTTETTGPIVTLDGPGRLQIDTTHVDFDPLTIYCDKVNDAGGFTGRDVFHVADWLSKELHFRHHTDPATQIDKARNRFQMHGSTLVFEFTEVAPTKFHGRFVGRVIQ